MAKTPAKTKQTMADVAPPGTTSATPTARPVIVGHRTAMKDPMVQDHGDAEEVTTTKQHNPTIVSKTIQPQSVSDSPAEKAPDTPESVLANAEATVGTVVDQFKGGNKPADQEAQPTTDVAELINSRKYVVPIGPSAARKQANSIAGVLVICVVLAAVAYAWMMGMIPFGQ